MNLHAHDFDASAMLREIARGKHSARDLTRAQTRTLFAAIFAGQVSELSLGALLIALRVKGESLEELAGMLEALQPQVAALNFPTRRAMPILIPSYNGTRKLPNLVPLLAILLSREGVPVLIHGEIHEARRVGTFEILHKLGYPSADSLVQAEQQLQQHNLAAISLALLCPPLHRLIALRETLGVRNCGHTLAKLLLPSNLVAEQVVRLVALTHPDFMELLRAYFAEAPANVWLMRGVEGEPMLRLHAPQEMQFLRTGQAPHSVQLAIPEAHDPQSLPANEAEATATWTAEVLAGKRAIPEVIAHQVAVLACSAGAGTG